MSDHARFSPSGAHRWIPCPGSIALLHGRPSETSSFAAEGTAAHDLAAKCLEQGVDAKEFIGQTLVVDKDGANFKFKVDAAFAADLQTYLDSVRRRAENGVLLVEQKVEFSKSIGVEGQFGTSDAIIWDLEANTLTVDDLKFGRGVKVYAEENPQAMLYGLGVIETFGEILEIPEDAKVLLVISQPRLDHEDEWETTVAHLREFAKDAASAAYNAQNALAQRVNFGLEKVNPTAFNPGAKQCRWCDPANCKAAEKAVAKGISEEFEDLDAVEAATVRSDLALPREDKLGQRFGMLELIENWCKAVRGEVERRVLQRETVIGPDGQPMKVVEGRKGHSKWLDEEQAESVLVGLLPVDKVYAPQKIVTPAKVKAVLDKKKTAAQWEAVKTLINQGKGKPTVVLGSDPRPTYAGEASADEFENLED